MPDPTPIPDVADDVVQAADVDYDPELDTDESDAPGLVPEGFEPDGLDDDGNE